MRTASIILSLSLFISGVSAQKVSREKVKIGYVRFPEQKLDSSIETYTYHLNSLRGNYIERLGSKGNLHIHGEMPGYERVEREGDLQIHIRFISGLEFISEAANEHERSKTVGKGENKKKVKYMVYDVLLNYRTPVFEVTATDHQTRTVFKETYGGHVVKESWEDYSTTNEHLSASSALSAWSKNKQSYLAKKEMQFSGLRQLNGFVRTYCLTHSSEEFKIPSIKKSKRHTYDGLNRASDMLMTAMKRMSSDQICPVNTLRRMSYDDMSRELSEVIEVLTKLYAERDTDDRKAKVNTKVLNAICYNLVLAHMWKGEFDKADMYLGLNANLMGGKGMFEGTRKLEDFYRVYKQQYLANLWRGEQMNTQPTAENACM